MKRNIITLFCSVTLLALPLNAQMEVPAVFGGGVPDIGSVETETTTMQLKMKMRVIRDGKEIGAQDRNQARTMRRHVTILGTAADAVTKIRSTFEAVDDREEDDKNMRVKRSPISGRTFIVEVNNGKVTALDEKGAALPDDISAIVSAQHKDLGRKQDLMVLSGRTIKPGDKVTELAEIISRSIKSSGSSRIVPENVEVIYAGLVRENGLECGLFHLRVNVAGSQDGMNLTMRLTGRMAVAVKNAMPLYMAMEGPITLGGKKDTVELDGLGSMYIRTAYDYEPAGSIAK